MTHLMTPSSYLRQFSKQDLHSDDFGLRSPPRQSPKTFERKCATSIVECLDLQDHVSMLLYSRITEA